jgi:hypothetical protein
LANAGFTALLISIIGYFQNRKINRIKAEAEANTAEADYSDRIIKQSDIRVEQIVKDKKDTIEERDRMILLSAVIFFVNQLKSPVYQSHCRC